MKTKMMLAALALGLGLLTGTQARAAVGQVSDSLTVTITPNAFYAVDITTNSAELDLGFVDLNTSTRTVKPSTVTIQSSYAATDLKLQGSISGGWLFDSDTATLEQDRLAAWGVFTDTSVAAAPVQGGGYFSGTVPGAAGSDAIDATSRDVGTVAAANPKFVALSGEAGYKTMESLPPFSADPAASRSHLWLNFRLPPSTTVTGAQSITITLTAGAPN